jgi:ribosomal protein S12 methylthiotransferase accessory factor
MAQDARTRWSPSVPPQLRAQWLRPLATFQRVTGGLVSLGLGWDLDWERDQWQVATAAGSRHLSVRILPAEVQIGPQWVPGTDSGCASCAELRSRIAVNHPLAGALAHRCGPGGPARPLLPELLAVALTFLARQPLASGELYAVGVRSARRHRVPRSFACPVCAPAPTVLLWPEPPDAAVVPTRPLRSHPADPDNPARAADTGRRLSGPTLRSRLVDPRFGPVLQVMRERRTPFAMSMAVAPDSVAMGYGRAGTFGEAEPVAVLEAYERMAGFPHDTPLVADRSFQEVAEYAVDPAKLGRYTPRQLAHPHCRVMPSTAQTPMDWVWGHDIDTGLPRLVPAEVGFYQYDYLYRRDRHAGRRGAAGLRRYFFFESSSGCALGSNATEAALHSLLELAERDAFLLSWHRGTPLPVIAISSIQDLTSRRLLQLISARGFQTHLLVATQDVDVPVVWALAVNRRQPYPACFSSAGSGIDPASAVRGALWEVAQLVTDQVPVSRAEIEPMLDDPWLVGTMEDHYRRYTLPELLDRVTAVVGSRQVALDEAFPGWPRDLLRQAGGDLLGALRYVRARFADAGLDQIVLVDQSTREHRDLGLAVVKAVVPGILPMCFGQANQRLVGLPRLDAALAAGKPAAERSAPYEPHPFP